MVNLVGKAPGVIIDEQPAVGPIAGTGTSTPAFIGKPTKLDGNAGELTQVTNWTEYTTAFGGYTANEMLPYAVRGFFENGGTRAYVVPLATVDLAGVKSALASLESIGDASIICLPGATTPAFQKEVIGHCESMKDRFAILDGDQGKDAAGAFENPLANSSKLQKQRGLLNSDNGFAALYWPWIVISDPASTTDPPTQIAVAPSGHIAGIYSRSDDTRGVHKAPANEVIAGALGVDYAMSNTQQGTLNDSGINAIRLFPNRPPVVWGARTTAPLDQTAYRYINVRRLIAFIEDSLVQGMRWAVFEPNNIALWKKLERTIAEFLNRVWQSGALFGRVAEQAFYVKIDEELNPPDKQKLGVVTVEIGVAPVKPAEFVVLQIGLWDGGPRITES